MTSLSLSRREYQETRTLARRKGLTQSELIREALATYRRLEDNWDRALKEARRAFKESGIKTEVDVERLMDELRG